MLRLFRKIGLTKNESGLPGQSGSFIRPTSFSILAQTGQMVISNPSFAYDADPVTYCRNRCSSTYSSGTGKIRYLFNNVIPAGSVLYLKYKLGFNSSFGSSSFSFTKMNNALVSVGSVSIPKEANGVVKTMVLVLTEDIKALDFTTFVGQSGGNNTEWMDILDISIEL